MRKRIVKRAGEREKVKGTVEREGMRVRGRLAKGDVRDGAGGADEGNARVVPTREGDDTVDDISSSGYLEDDRLHGRRVGYVSGYYDGWLRLVLGTWGPSSGLTCRVLRR